MKNIDNGVSFLRRAGLSESLEAYAERTKSPCTCNKSEPTHYPKRDFWRHRSWCLFGAAYHRWRAYANEATGWAHIKLLEDHDARDDQAA